MNKSIRKSAFETNSSSTHSLVISNSVTVLETLPVDSNGNLDIYGMDFGWGPERYNDAASKLSYCFLDSQGNNDMTDLLKESVIEYLNSVFIPCKNITFHENDGYIDHQSCGTSHEVFHSKKDIINFIFNRDCELIIDNDNG